MKGYRLAEADAAAVLEAVEWLALGFEIIDCVYVDWKFQPPDFVAAYGLGVGASRDDLDQVVAALRDRVDSGVHAHSDGAARQHIDAAALALLATVRLGHAADSRRSCVTNRVMTRVSGACEPS